MYKIRFKKLIYGLKDGKDARAELHYDLDLSFVPPIGLFVKDRLWKDSIASLTYDAQHKVFIAWCPDAGLFPSRKPLAPEIDKLVLEGWKWFGESK